MQAHQEVSCYFLLNYARIVEQVREHVEVAVNLLFSFELCWANMASARMAENVDKACYFLLNYARKRGSTPWPRSRSLGLLFSFELCRVSQVEVRFIKEEELNLLFSFELCPPIIRCT